METVITLVPLPDAALTDLKDALAQAALPHADVKEEGRQFFAGQCRGQSVGFIRFEVYGGEALLAPSWCARLTGARDSGAPWFRAPSTPPPPRAPPASGC